MGGRTEREAVENYVDPIQRALSCVTNAVLGHRGGYYPAPKPHVLTFAGTDGSVALQGVSLNLAFTQHYSFIPGDARVANVAELPYEVRTVYYAYGLEDRETGHEIFSYHWHPDGVSPVRHPHLHLERGAQIGRRELSEGHLPTGRVALEDVLTFVIEQFHAKPLKRDWRRDLARSRTLNAAESPFTP